MFFLQRLQTFLFHVYRRFFIFKIKKVLTFLITVNYIYCYNNTDPIAQLVQIRVT